MLAIYYINRAMKIRLTEDQFKLIESIITDFSNPINVGEHLEFVYDTNIHIFVQAQPIAYININSSKYM